MSKSINEQLKTINNIISILGDSPDDVVREQMECLQDIANEIDSEFDSLKDEVEELEEKVKDLQEEEESDFPVINHITISDCINNEHFDLSSTAIYADNLRDQNILEEFVKSMHYNKNKAA